MQEDVPVWLGEQAYDTQGHLQVALRKRAGFRLGALLD